MNKCLINPLTDTFIIMKKYISHMDIQAFIDGELSYEDGTQVRNHLQNDEQAFEYYIKMKTQKERLQLWATCMNTRNKLKTRH